MSGPWWRQGLLPIGWMTRRQRVGYWLAAYLRAAGAADLLGSIIWGWGISRPGPQVLVGALLGWAMVAVEWWLDRRVRRAARRRQADLVEEQLHRPQPDPPQDVRLLLPNGVWVPAECGYVGVIGGHHVWTPVFPVRGPVLAVTVGWAADNTEVRVYIDEP